MQSAYIGKLMELAERDSEVLHILADSGTGYDEMFRRNFPEQIYNFGISEENMVAAAAGMASVGKIPFVFTAGSFSGIYQRRHLLSESKCEDHRDGERIIMEFTWTDTSYHRRYCGVEGYPEPDDLITGDAKTGIGIS